MRSPQAPKLYQQNVFRSLKDFSDIVYFIVQAHRGTKPGSGLAVCSQEYKHHTACASRAALRQLQRIGITKSSGYLMKF